MADIAAGDVTCKVVSRRKVGAAPYLDSNLMRVEVDIELTIDPGTTDSYPTGGIPLTAAFTEASGEHIDTGLDVTQPIREIGGGRARISTGATVTTPAFFFNGGVTAASQTLVLQRAAALPSITGTGLAVASATSITDSGNGLVTAGFKVGDIISCDGWTGAAGNNGQVARVTAVAAGALTLAASGLTADAAGETVTIQVIYRPENADAEHANTDVTIAGDIAGGDADIIYRTTLVGFLRHTARAYTVTQ